MTLESLLNQDGESFQPQAHDTLDGGTAGPSPIMSLSFMVSPEEEPGPGPRYDDEGVPAGPPCHPYTVEHGYFVWYHRVDLGQDWRDVGREFRARFGEGRALVALQSLYCSFSRKKGVECRKIGAGLHVPGVMDWTDKRYSWMRPEHRRRPRRH